MSASLKRLSKFLAYMLRHQPERFGLTLDAQGVTNLDAVWQAVVHRFGSRYTWEDLMQVVAAGSDGKKRFEIVGHRIRALYGHNRRLGIINYGPAVKPPEVLYHGTSPRALKNIREQGLLPQKRQMVHLALSPERALQVGKRHAAQPVLLRIRAQDAFAHGIPFYHPEEQHYLAPHIPPQFIEFPS